MTDILATLCSRPVMTKDEKDAAEEISNLRHLLQELVSSMEPIEFYAEDRSLAVSARGEMAWIKADKYLKNRGALS